ncbi:MAG: asparagine synthetase B family protein, partial [Steroidobacteraceae bacterium]
SQVATQAGLSCAPAVIDSIGACWASSTATGGAVAVAVVGDPVRVSGGSVRTASAASLLAEYRSRGIDVLDGLAGRFALAIVDGETRRTLLAIDPMGIEKLTFAARGPYFVFSASALAVAASPAISAPLSRQGLFDYLLMHMIPAPGTIFRDVSKLRPGTCAIFEHGRVETRRYWEPPFEENGGAPFAELAGELKSSLRAAVRECGPDEHTGAFLSGGLDSSTVAGVLSEVGPRPARTFSIGFGYPEYDELPYARIANARFGCKGHEYSIRGTDIAATFPQIARAYDEPFGNSSALPVYYCARLAREHGVDHLLAGDGGDELFAGNSRYAEQQIFERYRLIPAPLRHGILEPLLSRWPSRTPRLIRRARGYVEKANTPLPSRLESWNVIYRAGPAEFLDPDFLAAIDPRAPLVRMHEVWDAAPCRSTLNHMLYYDWQYTLSDNDLRKVATMTALAGVRVSYPMLHPRVIDVSVRVPPRLKMPGMKLRHFYKRAMHGFLPEEIIQKKKHGFGLPFGLWLAEHPALRDLIFDQLASLRSRRIVRAEFIDRLLRLHEDEDARYYGVFLWVLAMLEQWLQEHRLQFAA